MRLLKKNWMKWNFSILLRAERKKRELEKARKVSCKCGLSYVRRACVKRRYCKF